MQVEFKLSCACTNKALTSVEEPRPNTANRRSGDPSASGTALRVSVFGFTATKYDLLGEVIVKGSVGDI